MTSLMVIATSLVTGVAQAADPFSGTVALAADRTETEANPSKRSSTLTATASTPVYGPYTISIYDDLNNRVASCSGTSSSGYNVCTATVTPANNATRTYTAYVAQDYPTLGPPVSDVKASSSPVSVTNVGYAGTLTLATNRVQTDAQNPAATVTATASTPVYGPYTISIYDDLNARVASCSGGPSSGYVSCAATVSPPSNGVRTYTAYVAQDYPTAGPPINDVKATSDAVTVVDVRNDSTAAIALLAVAAPVMLDPCIEMFPRGPNTNQGSLNDLQEACETARAAGLSWSATFAQLVANAGSLILVDALIAAHDGGARLGAPPRPGRTPEDPTAVPPGTTPLQPGPPLFDSVFLDGGSNRILQRDRVINGHYTQPTDAAAAARTVYAQCIRLAAFAGSGIARTDCDTKPIFAPGADIDELALHAWEVISQSPSTVKMKAVKRTEQTLQRTWYNAAPYAAYCALPMPGQECDEYPYYSSEDAGPRPSGDLYPGQLKNVDGDQNGKEGFVRGAFHTTCGLTTPPRGDPKREFIVVPMPEQDLIPTLAYCRPGQP